MKYLEQAIRDAERGGLKLPVGYQFVVATNERRFGKNTANEMFYMWLFSQPETWRCLGKTRGWDGFGKSIFYKEFSGQTIYSANIPVAEYYQHRLIDALAEGRTAEEFFEGLAGKK